MFMPKKPVSVTLDVDNLLWLKGQATSGKRRSLSDTIDALLTAARTGARGATASRSVVGTVDIADDDPGLDQADAFVRKELETSLRRGPTARESRAAYGSRRFTTAPRKSVTRRKPRG
jgi:hypothetical protein